MILLLPAYFTVKCKLEAGLHILRPTKKEKKMKKEGKEKKIKRKHIQKSFFASTRSFKAKGLLPWVKK